MDCLVSRAGFPLHRNPVRLVLADDKNGAGTAQPGAGSHKRNAIDHRFVAAFEFLDSIMASK